MLQVIGRTRSINVRKVLWTCDELGIEYELQAPDAVDLRTFNPNALVPVIVDGDFVLWESNAICRYLARREQRTDVLPDAPKACARVDQWLDWQATELNNSWRYAFLALVRNSPKHADADAIAASVASWNRHIGILDGRLAETRAYVAGDAFTLADIGIGLSLHRWLMSPIERHHFAHVGAYHARLLARSAYRTHAVDGMP